METKTKREFCLNPRILFEVNLEKICKNLEEILRMYYTGDSYVTCSFQSTSDGLFWLTLGVETEDGKDLEKRILVNLPYWEEFESEKLNESSSINLNFFNFDDEEQCPEIAKLEFDLSILDNEDILKQFTEFLSFKTVDETPFRKIAK